MGGKWKLSHRIKTMLLTAEKLLQEDQGKIQPQGSISRATCAAMIQRFCDKSFYA